jgi:hypothetical protein
MNQFMLNQRSLAGFLLAYALMAPAMGFAQATTDPDIALIQPVITGPEDVAVGRTIVLDASLTRSALEPITYQWFIEGRAQPISDTVEAVYTPEVPGVIAFRLVVRSRDEAGDAVQAQTTHTVTVYSRKIVLVADPTVPADKLDAHLKAAEEAGVFLRILQPPISTVPIGNEEQITQLLSERAAVLAGANPIILWTEGIGGLQALMRAAQGDNELLAGLRNQSIIMITDGSLPTLARIARGPFTELNPQQILLTRAEAINPLMTAPDMTAFMQQLEQRDIDHLRIDDSTAGIRPWNLLSSLVNAMLTRGVPSQTVILLLVLPVIAMILAFLKQVVGITTFGLYTPSIIALSFLALGWQLGILFLLFIVLTGYATRAFMQRWRLLYIPKVAVILTVVSITLMILMGISAFFEVTFSRETIFILLIMSTLAESFLNMKTEQGLQSALLGIAETVFAALICVFVVQWGVFQSLVLAYPEVILLTIIVDVILGRWTGLRLVEYFRFRDVFKHLQEEE